MKKILYIIIFMAILFNLALSGDALSAEKEINKDNLKSLLKQKWERVKGALKQKDIEGALGYFSEQSKPKYRQIFEALKDQLPAIMDTYIEFNIISISENTAEYEMVSEENSKRYSHPGRFVKDYDGVWRFKDF